ncbi:MULTISPECIES: tRNA pseudouridine(55) synthase TruB [unclassified Roseitalea]|uniref:tRNA pseudouridine(55) synthase TruB n=1 Tax=unclassified Roseitalea TaxID=2639107 RepID=UPI00273E0985|nr:MULTISPECIES: tRNA pseudouridine(55) synthase TruB [unclassified Roseitalea]
MSRQRKKKGRPVSGWLVLDKPLGLGSTQAVSKVKWLFGAQKAGHAGTLDPLATGILPIALGEATKTVPYVMDGTKIYRFTVCWGRQTTTDDAEGETVETADARPERAAIEALLPRYTGVISQRPPQFSAIKIGGERAHALARQGEAAQIAAREIEIDRLDILAHDGATTEFEVECGKGTYVRALARDMGRDLGCFGHVCALRRTVVDPFEEADAVTLAALERAAGDAGEDRQAQHAALDAMLLKPGDAMAGFPRVELSDDQARRIRLGNDAIIRGRDAPLAEDEACAFHKGRLLAIGEIAHGCFKPRRVLKA